MPVLVDSSFLYAVVDVDDKHHRAARNFLVVNHTYLVPDVTLAEITHVVKQRMGQPAMVAFLKMFVALEIQLEPVTLADTERSITIMETYADARFDFVDCAIMALAEWLNITQVCTFDRRDFGIFRPKHCDYLELLP